MKKSAENVVKNFQALFAALLEWFCDDDER